jgi:hypothetical protein
VKGAAVELRGFRKNWNFCVLMQEAAWAPTKMNEMPRSISPLVHYTASIEIAL